MSFARLSRRRLVALAVAIGGGTALAVVQWMRPALPDATAIEAAYGVPLAAPNRPLRVFHLGHSLVGRDMPAMLEQLAPEGHSHHSQLGWGTSLKQHWDPDVPINGFEAENAHPRFRAADVALGSGQYDAVVLTEMVELRDAIRYHDSAAYLRKWADLARNGNPAVRVYLYETWHRLDDAAGWLNRLDNDLGELWERALALPVLGATKQPIHVIPAGQVMARVARSIETGDMPGLTTRQDLFARDAAGTVDPIHLNDLGHYLVALTHYAVLYHASPVGLKHRLTRADGTPADAPSEPAARAMQQIVWDVVTAYPKTGVAP